MERKQPFGPREGHLPRRSPAERRSALFAQLTALIQVQLETGRWLPELHSLLGHTDVEVTNGYLRHASIEGRQGADQPPRKTVRHTRRHTK
jgi:hypothetical protein